MSSGLESASEAMILSDRHARAHKRMWAAVNLEFLRQKNGWTEEDTIELSDMLGLTEEMNWVRGSKPPRNSSEPATTSGNSRRRVRTPRPTTTA